MIRSFRYGSAFLLCSTLLQAPSALADPQRHLDSSNRASDAPWLWTDEDRLSVRFDPTSIKARGDQAAASGADAQLRDRSGNKSSQDRSYGNVVIGRFNPELFLPFELFEYLIRDGFSFDLERQSAYREQLDPIVAREMQPEEFWVRLDAASRSFVEYQQRQKQLASKLNSSTNEQHQLELRQALSAMQPNECSLRHAALVAASDAIGRDTLLRILYTAIAPTVSSVSTGAETEFALSFAARGCK